MINLPDNRLIVATKIQIPTLELFLLKPLNLVFGYFASSLSSSQQLDLKNVALRQESSTLWQESHKFVMASDPFLYASGFIYLFFLKKRIFRFMNYKIDRYNCFDAQIIRKLSNFRNLKGKGNSSPNFFLQLQPLSWHPLRNIKSCKVQMWSARKSKVRQDNIYWRTVYF
jgi:hypothetical protein